MLRSAVAKTASVLSKLPQQSKLNLVQIRTMFNMDPFGFDKKLTPSSAVSDFIFKLHGNDFISEESVTVFEVGCGPGRLTSKILFPLFPNVTKWYAIDILPGMIEYAKTRHSEPNIEYNLADIEDWDSVKKWEGQISKLFAINSFQWVQNQKLGFENIYKLLCPGGDAAFFIVLQAKYFEAMKKIHDDPKWKSCFIEVENFVGVPHMKSYRAVDYQEMVKNVGFTVDHIEQSLSLEPFSNDQACREYLASICGLVEHIPDHRREEFKDDLFWHVIRECGRTNEGRPLHIASVLELVIRKDSLR